jgi:hypothetical protein
MYRSDQLPNSRNNVMETSPLISVNSGYETSQIFRSFRNLRDGVGHKTESVSV